MSGGLDSLDRVHNKNVGYPDLVVEVSSPSTRRTDLIRKRAVFEASDVTEFWFIDLENLEILVHRWVGESFTMSTLGHDEELTSRLLSGLRVPAARLLPTSVRD